MQDIQSTGLDMLVHLQLETLLAAIHESDRLAKRIEQQVLAIVKPTEPYRRIQMISGIGMVLGLPKRYVFLPAALWLCILTQ